MPQKKRLYVRSLKKESEEGRRFSDLFLVLRKNLTTTASNQPYLRLTLADSSDSIEAFVWDDAAECDRLVSEGEIISVEGAFKTFRGAPQVIVKALHRLREEELSELDPGEFLPTSRRPRKQMSEELNAILAQVRNPALVGLFEAFSADREFREAFLTAPAATGFHHAYVGGLLEHTLGVSRLAQAVGALYANRLNPEILVAGAFLHDVGKVRELSCKGRFDYTDEGRLVGHLVMGAQMLREKVDGLAGFPEPLTLQLEHLILSHHGEKQWGSPVEPQTLEAIVLHFLDNLDAKICGASEWLEKEVPAGSSWSTYWKGLGRQLFAKSLTGPDFGEGKPHTSMSDVEAQLLSLEVQDGEGEGQMAERQPPGEAEGKKRSRRNAPGQGSLGF